MRCASPTISNSFCTLMPVSSSTWRKWPSTMVCVGKLFTPEKPISFTLPSQCHIRRRGSVACTPQMTGISFTTGSTSYSPISIATALASPYAISPHVLPCPLMRKRPQL